MTLKQWYRIRAAETDTDEAEILIYDDIGGGWFGGVGAEEFVRALGELSAATLNVRIKSRGGDVFEGVAIANALQRYDGRVVTHIDSLAASIASVIAMAGDEVRIAENAFLMIHDPWAGLIGDADDMRSMAETLDKITDTLARTYMRKTGSDEERVREWMRAETWFNAEEAKAEGFVDEVVGPSMARASVDVSRFRNAPRELRPERRTEEPPSPPEEPAAPAAVDETQAEVLALAAASALTLERTRL